MTATEINTVGRWRIDRTVNVSLVFVIIVQTMTLIWGAATLAARQDNTDKQLQALSPLPERVAGLAATIDAVKTDTADIKLTLRQARR